MGTGKVGHFTRAGVTPKRTAAFTIGVGLLAVLAGLMVTLVASASHAAPALPLTSPLTGPGETPDCTAADPTVLSLGLPSSGGSGSGNRAHAGTRDSVAVWANATAYPDITAFDMSTSETIINGEAVSRSHMKIAGSNNQIRHNTEYGLANQSGQPAFHLSGADNCFSGAPAIAQVARATPAQPQGFPFNFDIDNDGDFLEHYAPGSPAALAAMADPFPGPQYFVCGVADPDGAGDGAAVAAGCTSGKMDVSVSGLQLDRGLYYVTGEAVLAGQGLLARVTLVAGGNIKVSGSNQGEVSSRFTPYTQSLLFLSNFGTPNSNIGEDAVKVEGSVSLFEGVVHAPKGRTTLAGSQLSFTCIVMGDRVRISGQLIYIDGDTCPTPGPGAPTIEVVKTADPLSRPEPGGNFTFNVTVNNDSTTSVTITSLNDDIYGPLTGDADCQVGTVLAANTGTCSFSFTGAFAGNAGASQTDIVTACAQGAGGSDCDDDDATVTITDVPSSIVVTKTPNPSSLPEPGGPVTFTVLVQNTSVTDDVTLTATSFTDKVGAGPVEQISNIDCNGATAGNGLPLTLQEANAGTTDEVTCTFVKAVNGNAGASITDVVEVTGTDDDGNPVKDDDDATVTITDVPSSIVVTKTPNPSSLPEPGGNVTFTVVVRNTSVTDDVTLTATSFTDKVGAGPVEQISNIDCNGATAGNGLPLTLQEANAGTTDEVTCTFVKAVNGNAGASITDVVEVTGTDDDGNPVKDDDDATVTITDVPSSIVVTKTPNPSSLPEPGGNVTFTVVVTNTSVTDDVTLTATSFTDKVGAGPVEQISNIDCNGATAGNGLPLTLQEANAGTTDEVTCTFVKAVNGNAGASITDVVEVTGTDDDGNPVKDDDDATVTITDVPSSDRGDEDAEPELASRAGRQRHLHRGRHEHVGDR